MKQLTRLLLVFVVAMTACVSLMAVTGGDSVMMREADGTYVVNTSTLGRNVRGYAGATPLKVYIRKDRVVKVEALSNKETPRIFAKVESGLLHRWNGKKVSKAAAMKVDAVSGATYSSNAVAENVRLALQYYNTHK